MRLQQLHERYPLQKMLADADVRTLLFCREVWLNN